MGKNDLEIALLDSVAKDNLKDLIGDAAEYTIDSILESEELKEIPVFGTLIRIATATSSIRDRLFAKKVYKFLACLRDVSPEKRKNFIQSIESKEGGQRRLGETILLLLERLDDMKKPDLIGKVLRQCIVGKIQYKTALRLCSIIDRAYFPDLEDLVRYYEGDKIGYDVSASLAGLGLMEISGIDGGHFPDGGTEDDLERGGVQYSITWHGELLIKQVLLDDMKSA